MKTTRRGCRFVIETETQGVYSTNVLNQYDSIATREPGVEQIGRSDTLVASVVGDELNSANASQESLSDNPTSPEENADSSEATGVSLLPFVPAYDDDGNITSVRTSTGTWQITYNAENQPIRWTNAATGTVITMSFDSQGRRTEYKSVTNGTQNTWLRFPYDGYLCIQVLYSNSPYNTFKEFVWDPTEPTATKHGKQKEKTWF